MAILLNPVGVHQPPNNVGGDAIFQDIIASMYLWDNVQAINRVVCRQSQFASGKQAALGAGASISPIADAGARKMILLYFACTVSVAQELQVIANATIVLDILLLANTPFVMSIPLGGIDSGVVAPNNWSIKNAGAGAMDVYYNIGVGSTP